MPRKNKQHHNSSFQAKKTGSLWRKIFPCLRRSSRKQKPIIVTKSTTTTTVTTTTSSSEPTDVSSHTNGMQQLKHVKQQKSLKNKKKLKCNKRHKLKKLAKSRSNADTIAAAPLEEAKPIAKENPITAVIVLQPKLNNIAPRTTDISIQTDTIEKPPEISSEPALLSATMIDSMMKAKGTPVLQAMAKPPNKSTQPPNISEKVSYKTESVSLRKSAFTESNSHHLSSISSYFGQSKTASNATPMPIATIQGYINEKTTQENSTLSPALNVPPNTSVKSYGQYRRTRCVLS